MKKIKILQLINGLPVGGAQKVVLDLCRYLDKQAFEVVVVSMIELTEMVPEFEALGIRVKVFNLRKTPKAFARTFQQLSQFIQAEGIQIIHAHLYNSGFAATLLKLRFRHLKFVFTPHTYNLEARGGKQFVKWTKSLRAADILFSDKMKISIYRADAQLIANGIAVKNYEMELPKFPVFTFLSIGRIGPEKNQAALLAPIKQLKEKGIKCQLLIAGKGPLQAELAAAIAHQELDSEVKLLGQRSDIPALCNQAHCLVLPSLWEGLPIVLLEAGASNLPIISTNVGSIDMLLNDENGYLLSNIKALPQTMEQVLTNYDEALGKAAKLKQKMLKDFDINAVVKKHEALYENVLYPKQTKELVVKASA